MTSPPGARLLAALAGLVVITGPELGAQNVVGVDPYTRGDDAAMKQAGYVSFAPFPFGEKHTTRDVEALLGDEKLHWVETAHFRIGCALSPIAVRKGDADWKRRLKQELKRLRERLPRVKSNARTLDPWLRVHLIAQRLEDCYAEVQRDLGVTDASFPESPMDSRTPPEKYYGEGRFLGMKQKYTVLIVRRMASNARYTRAYGEREVLYPTRLFFPGHGALGVCLSQEYNSGQLENDHTLHVQLVYNVVINLLSGYRSYAHGVPTWLELGMAHWYSRRISPKYPVYDVKNEDEREESDFWKWDERALGLMKFEAFEPVADLMRRHDSTKFGMEEHIQAWFFVDYLMHARKEQMAQFIRAMKDPFHERRRSPTHDEINARQMECFKKVFGIGPEALEAEWRQNTRRLKHRK